MTVSSEYELVLISDGAVLKVQVEGDLGHAGEKQLSEICIAAEKLGIEVQVEASAANDN